MYHPSVAAVAGQFYTYRVWSKRTAGTSGGARPLVHQSGNIAVTGRSHASVDWAECGVVLRSLNANNISFIIVRERGSSSFDTVIVDDHSAKQIAQDEMFALLDAGTPDNTVKAQWVWDNREISGVVARADADEAPTNFLYLYYIANAAHTNVFLDKFIDGTPTNLLNTTVVGNGEPSSEADLELRCAGTTVQVFYDGVQKGGDITVSDAELVNNTHFGVASTGGSQLKRFFVGN